MSEQIPSILVTLTVFNTSVAIHSNDSTRTINMSLKKDKSIKKIKKNITRNKKTHETLKNKKIKYIKMFFLHLV